MVWPDLRQHGAQIYISVMGLLWCGFVHASSGYDLVTMKNGDIHQGTVAQEKFTLETSYGLVSVPYHLMASLHIGKDAQQDYMTTRLGDTFSGKLVDTRFPILRAIETTLLLNISDIDEISFVPRSTLLRDTPVSAAIETAGGDRFLGNIQSTDLMLKTPDTLRLVSLADIRWLDVASRLDDEDIHVQLTLNDGEIFQGQLLSSSIPVANRYGQLMELPLIQLSMLSHHSPTLGDAPHFNYRHVDIDVPHIQDRLSDGSYGPQLVVLPGGEYVRGDNEGDEDEKPAIRIKPGVFAIGVYEITFAEYDHFCKQTRRTMPADQDWGRGNRPVVNVSWEDAMAYILWLSDKTGQTYRLPTDGEWEYAARAGSDSQYWWGSELGLARANCEGCGSLWDGDKTAPVGRFPANAFGLHDTAGNVFEWVADCYHNSFEHAPPDGAALDKPGCGKRVIRGGAWSFPPKEIRSANRWRDFPSRRSDDTGFRVVREISAGK
ncbi:MAG TPA: formylglycine-generating enzyme family protein [Gammaproteobacteria bacterium]